MQVLTEDYDINIGKKNRHVSKPYRFMNDMRILDNGIEKGKDKKQCSIINSIKRLNGEEGKH